MIYIYSTLKEITTEIGSNYKLVIVEIVLDYLDFKDKLVQIRKKEIKRRC